MRKFARITTSALVLTTALFGNLLTTRPAAAQAPSAKCQEGTQLGGAQYQICLPAGTWNGDLVVYAHGYVPAGSGLALPSEAGQISSAVMPLGYAFATTSYRVNGLAVLPAQEDLLDLVQIFQAAHSAPGRVFLVGASEGGLITTLSIEQHPDVYAGGLEMCGPVGDFQDQVNYFGDFRVVFDALFPGMIPGSPTQIPDPVVNNWYSLYHSKILPAVTEPANHEKVRQLFAITGAPFNANSPQTMESTIRGALGYNIFATNDASAILGGNPYDNRQRVYSGSADDTALNRMVERIQADPQAVQALAAYRTSGDLQVPLVAIHTTGDEIVPYFHLGRYQQKVESAGKSSLLETITVNRYGHCNFTSGEFQNAFSRLAQMASAPRPTAAAPTLAPAPTGTPASTPTSLPEASIPQPGAHTAQQVQQPNPVARLWAWLVQSVRGLVQ